MAQLDVMPMGLAAHAPVRFPRLARLLTVSLLVGPPIGELMVLAPSVYQGMVHPLAAATAYLYCLPLAYAAGAIPALLGGLILHGLAKTGVGRASLYGLSILSGFAAMVAYGLMLAALLGSSTRYASGDFFSSATTVLHMGLFGIVPALVAAFFIDRGLFSALDEH